MKSKHVPLNPNFDSHPAHHHHHHHLPNSTYPHPHAQQNHPQTHSSSSRPPPPVLPTARFPPRARSCHRPTISGLYDG
ncbi:hypothetical protein M430DRAFT_190845 [Amorphotheca resinae ATCC 22711]|uniref:Uncharacterized protein n=1 Tax=Amorphotheca resinae ATCC 22711 TaxID=857342 RepID=A0A2T3APM0_AMORE|nr:hypothetical protein M430DRAFT_190845 [Amorphotheca resinae ATCC 22711]PSS06953.1 hypothetical protein M430DRAFT_190845 [Amorphotheca resinae ATCC 22711]